MTTELSEMLAVWGIILLECAFFVGIVALAVGVGYYSRQAQQKAWGELAARTGLTFEAGGFFGPAPRVSGTYRGHALTLDTFTRGSGKSRTTYTRIVLFVNNAANIYLALYQEGVFSKIGKFFGMQDIQIGDEEIDRRFIIKSKPESFAAGLFTSISLRQQVLQTRTLNVEVDGRELTFEQVGVLKDVDYLKFLFDLLSDVAERVERAG
jgi:hypothetical protein